MKDVKLNLGCGNTILPGYINIDKYKGAGILSHNLESGLPASIENDSVSFIKAHHILEHIYDLDGLMDDIWLVCEQGARLDIIVPLANTLWDVADPSHVRRFNHKTFEYYCKGFTTSYDRPRQFKLISQAIERFPNEWFEGIEWLVANLHVVLEIGK